MTETLPVSQIESRSGLGHGPPGRKTGKPLRSSITVQSHLLLPRTLTLEIARISERTAISAARFRGGGSEMAIDQAAVDAVRRELVKLAIDGAVVIGEGERDEAPMLFIDEKVGKGTGARVDIAVDPLEGTTSCAKDMPGAITTIAIAEGGTLLNAPDVYMEKMAIGPRYPRGIVDLDVPPAENIAALAKAKGVKTSAITGGHSRSTAACRSDRGGTPCRCGGAPHYRWRCRGGHPRHPTGGDRYEHLNGHRRGSGGRACRGGLALRRGTTAVPARA
jgi:Bacterial fructose-1,6-bisphosphatase, glpX-encoded